jgi:hypothetical protein
MRIFIYFSILAIVVLVYVLKRKRSNENFSKMPAAGGTIFNSDNKLVLFNPSLEIYDDNNFIAVCRNSNASECSTYRGGGALFWRPDVINENLLLLIDRKTLLLKNEEVLTLPDPTGHERLYNSGVEDLRLFYFAGELWVCGSTRDYNKDVIYEIFLSNFKESFIVKSNEHQKNWVPIIFKDRLFFVKSFSPLIIVEFLRAGDFVQVDYMPNNLPKYRGNTPFINTARGLLSIVHLKTDTKTQIHYSNYFILLSPEYPFYIEKVSRAFSITGNDIEFFVGLVLEGEHVLVSYGINDCKAAISILNVSDIWELFD